MSLILLDGLEDLSSYTITGTPPTIVSGRNGNGWQHAGAGVTSWATFNIPTSEQTDTLTVGFAWNATTLVGLPIIDLMSDNNVIQHDRLYVRNNAIEVQRASSTSVYNQSFGFAANTWYYVEFSVKLHDTLGEITARVNGMSLGTLTGLDTKNGGSKTVFDAVRIIGMGNTSTTYDDLYLTNDATPLGDTKIETLYPNGNGATNQFIGSDGNSTDNYLLVDEAGTPVWTDFTQSSTSGQRDLYTMTDLVTTSGTVRGVCPAAHIVKTDGGTRQAKLAVRGSAVNTSPARDLTTTAINQHWATTINPETGLAWTIAEVNALQSGVEIA